MSDYRPRWGDEWKTILPKIRQLGAGRVSRMLDKLYEGDFLEQDPTYNRIGHIAKPGRGIVAGCIHYPFHNPAFHESMLALIEHVKPDFFVLAGDALDQFSISSHNTGKVKKITLQDEYDATQPRLDEIDAALPSGCVKYFLEGNHEDRISRFKSFNENAKLGGALIDYVKGLRLLERKYEVLRPYNRAKLIIGDLLVIHGIYASKHAAAKHLQEYKQSLLFFHTHRWQMYSEGKHTAYNCGWGGDSNHWAFDYSRDPQRDKWVNALAVVDLLETGKAVVTQLRHDNGFYFEGKVF
jgi:predicted phosphodiesterase